MDTLKRPPGVVELEEEDLAREVSPFRRFGRDEWAALRADTPMTLTEADLDEVRSLNDKVDAKLTMLRSAQIKPGSSPWAKAQALMDDCVINPIAACCSN